MKAIGLAAFAATVALTVAVSACASGNSQKSAQGSQSKIAKDTSVLVDGTTDTVTQIDPAGNYEEGTYVVDNLIFEHLLELKPGGGVMPGLATKYTSNAKLTAWTCTLRKGVKFQNGASFTSADVKWSFDRLIAIKDPSAIYTMLGNLKSVTTNGPYSVTFNLTTPQSTWPFILASGGGRIVPRNAYRADKINPNSNPQYGTGPYQLVKYTPGQQAVFKAWSGYWGPQPKTPNLIINYYSKSSTMMLALQEGAIDMVFRDFTPSQYIALAKTAGITVHTGKGAAIRFLVLNVKRSPTNKLAVRQALAYLMPRQEIATRIYHGQVQPLYSVVPVGMGGHIDAFATLYGRTPNIAKARAVLKKAGISTPVPITIWWTPTHYGDVSGDEYVEMQRAFDSSGLFKVTLQSAEWATYISTLGKQYGAYQLGIFADYPDAENYLMPLYGTKTGFTSNGYSNPAMDAILAKEGAAPSTAARFEFVRQAELLAAKDVPIIPYFQAAMIAVSRNNVQGIDSTLDPSYVLRFWLLSKS